MTLEIVMLSVANKANMLSVIMLSVIMLGVVAPLENNGEKGGSNG
jgi:hypothetical protein